MTIFGFNTNVERDGVTYHVESQARQIDLLLQSMIFLKGQCVGKHAFSYAAMSFQPGFSEAAMHDLLKTQHKSVIDALQHGPPEKVLHMSGEIEDVGGSGLALKWDNPGEPIRSNQVVLHLQVLDAGLPVSGANIAVRPDSSSTDKETDQDKILAHAITGSSGAAVLTVPVSQSDEAGVIVQAEDREKSVTRKLRFKK